MNKDSFEFIVYILHACSDKWARLPSAVYKKLSESNCINQFLIPHYDILHTQGTQFVVNDIEDYLAARGIKI